MKLGALGTMVWDRIEHPDGAAVERWGGISYSLAALAAAIPEDWTVRPILKLGSDLADRGRAFLEAVPGLERSGAVVEVAEPNNQVELRYVDRHRRHEYLTGGVPGWRWSELAPHLEGLDGLYVNMISGFELDHETVERLAGHGTARYVDVHSLVLDVAADGRRVPRRPAHQEAWLRGFHVLQMNEEELAIVAGDDPPEAVARAAVRAGAAAVLVTRGPEGARWFAGDEGPVRWSGPRHESAEVETGAVTIDGEPLGGDPTGCGDVWGATCFAHLMGAETLTDAMAAANRAAVRNLAHRGAEGLYDHLRTTSWT